MVSGRYVADYFCKANHSISVDFDVHEILLSDDVFPVRSKSSLEKAFVVKHGKNKIDLDLEEHIFVEEEDELTFDHHGHDIKLPFKIDFKTAENYLKRLLEKNTANVKKPEITYEYEVTYGVLLDMKMFGPLLICA